MWWSCQAVGIAVSVDSCCRCEMKVVNPHFPSPSNSHGIVWCGVGEVVVKKQSIIPYATLCTRSANSTPASAHPSSIIYPQDSASSTRPQLLWPGLASQVPNRGVHIDSSAESVIPSPSHFHFPPYFFLKIPIHQNAIPHPCEKAILNLCKPKALARLDDAEAVF